ncbi:MAG: tRNA glutamyl-Q(34) synthetase GluQRS [Gammaproteobacteria bacterium]|nr:tRNA glutamyl-Q(34) synthetase GluQRS [Gammaproteobacteria bacterium]
MSAYVGRFAPSPTGPLHAGSLVAAVGSYLAARSVGGCWLLRIEDIDPPREMAGASDRILRSLEAHGLRWDGPVLFQSSRLEAYQAALDDLIARDLVYPCSCSRSELTASAAIGAFGPVYPGHCRSGPRRPEGRYAWRVRTDNDLIAFEDRRVGRYGQRLEQEVGDFVVRRADGLFAYQLAVVVDDAWQGVTDVVRGEDLLDNTPRQILLQRLLGFLTPTYLHLPLVRDADGQKLSKQTFAEALDDAQVTGNLFAALHVLGLMPPADLRKAPASEWLAWAVAHWRVPQADSSAR